MSWGWDTSPVAGYEPVTDTNERRGFIATGGFNTGRLYTTEGQRIYWGQRADGWLYFTDIDRCISGWMQRETPGDMSAPVLPGWLMRNYDRNYYQLAPIAAIADLEPIPARVPDGFDFGPTLRL